MRVVPYSALDSLMKEFNDGYEISYDEAYRRFREVQLDPPSDLPEDPFSPEYEDRILDLYKKVSGKNDYNVQNERSEFDIDALVYRPFPFYTKSLDLAATHFGLISQLFSMMKLSPGSDVLEFGFGWGHTTLSLAMLGHTVTAVDIEDRFCELVRRRAELFHVDVDIVNSDFLWVETTDKKFDAVVFFECFHHCWEFKRLLLSLHRVLKPGGKIYFGAEPINEQFKIPWGTRLDGESLFVARRGGWMELGFHSTFFSELLSRTGWRGRCVAPHFWVATSAAEPAEPIVLPADDPRLGSMIGTKTSGAITVAADEARQGPGYALHGPYIPLSKGHYVAVIAFGKGTTPVEGAVVDGVAGRGTLNFGARTVSSDEIATGSVSYAFDITENVFDFEIRLLVPKEFSGTIERVTITESSDRPIDRPASRPARAVREESPNLSAFRLIPRIWRAGLRWGRAIRQGSP
jgi:2-polyprenyl-3-methyl-5-hydroxy-6-metoxy-1,4-benzoquinol methylase